LNFYEVLGVGRDADREEIRAAYRRLSREYHPDVNDHPRASQQFTVLTRAEEVLTDPDERDAYDRLGHRDYVGNRIPGDLPDVAFHHVDGAGTGTQGGASGPSTSVPRDRGSASDDAPGGTGRNQGSASDDAPGGTGRKGPPEERPGRTRGSGRVADDGPEAADTSATAAAASGSSPDGSTGSERTHSTPPTPGASDQGGGGLDTTLWGHLTASARWMAVVASTGVYGVGLAAYLRAGDEGLGALVAALAAASPRGIVRAVGDAGYDLPGVVAFSGAVGVRDGVAPTDAALLLAGVVLVPLVTTAAVVGLRRRTTWRPSRLYAVGAFGPPVSVASEVAGGAGPLPSAALPLLAELLLLVVLPAAAVGAFLLSRLVLAAPVQRREAWRR
jgi:molecular chaperone DnaJ